MQNSSKKKNSAVIVTIVAAATGVGLWIAQQSKSSFPNEEIPPESLAEKNKQDSESSITDETTSTNASGNAENPSRTDAQKQASLSETGERIERGEAPGSGEFTRAEFFKTVDWGANLNAIPTKEPQNIKFSAACKGHPRNLAAASPADWAEAFSQSDALQRWPSASSHVIDWNQFWQLNETGYQVSIRWNFENPPRYSVVGYSFALNKPDGFGAPAFPEKMELTWDDAKSYVQIWEKKILGDGGKAGTRTMSLAEKVFNPAEVSPEDIERAEYTNSRVRAAQTGKMSCNTLSTDLGTLSCSCWF
jgi:hypothetical protein